MTSVKIDIFVQNFNTSFETHCSEQLQEQTKIQLTLSHGLNYM